MQQLTTVAPSNANWNSAPTIEIMNAGNGYMVIATTGDSLKVLNEALLTKTEAKAMAAQLRRQQALDMAAQAAPDNRCGRAMQLVASGAVVRNGDGYHVHSRNSAQVYHTTADSCDCPDATYNKATCKHMLAVKMTENMSEAEFLASALEGLRSGHAQPYVTLTDEELARFDEEPAYTDWRR